ncbi:MAG: nitrous oxide-stimulated promoter family protein [Pleomorphochaeta sp.]
MLDIEEKRNNEKKIVKEMITIYCKKNHKTKELCPSCNYILNYAYKRLDNCPFMATKTFCSNCPIHCYGEKESALIKKIMRFSGPRMLFHHPLLTLKHFYYFKIKSASN